MATIENNLRFPGQYYDAETELHYNWNRYYDPKTGRYLTLDPIGLKGGINLFLYVGTNPVNKSDFEGLKEKCCECDCPPLRKEWKPCIDDGLASFCTPDQAGFCKVRCMMWAETNDTPNPKGGVPGGGMMQIKWDLWEDSCKKQIKNFDKNKPCDQIKCATFILCKWAKGSVDQYGTITKPGWPYQKCMECCK